MEALIGRRALNRIITVSNNDFVCSADLKKFRRNYFDCIMRKFSPDSLKIDKMFNFLIKFGFNGYKLA